MTGKLWNQALILYGTTFQPAGSLWITRGELEPEETETTESSSSWNRFSGGMKSSACSVASWSSDRHQDFASRRTHEHFV